MNKRVGVVGLEHVLADEATHSLREVGESQAARLFAFKAGAGDDGRHGDARESTGLEQKSACTLVELGSRGPRAHVDSSHDDSL